MSNCIFKLKIALIWKIFIIETRCFRHMMFVLFLVVIICNGVNIGRDLLAAEFSKRDFGFRPTQNAINVFLRD